MSDRRWPLTGKTALITGAAKRLGRAMAAALAGEGVNVVVHYHRSANDAEDLVEQLREENVNSWSVQADLSRPAQAEALLERARQLAGPIDVLINNASVFDEGTVGDLTADQVSVNVQVNAISPFLIGRALADQGRDGAIINFLDARVGDYDREHAAYHISKRTLLTLTRIMALEFSPAVRVNAVAPGLILPPRGRDESYLQQLAPTNPLNRIGSLEAITDAVLFLLRSDFITGQVIFVDGGRHMKGNVYGC